MTSPILSSAHSEILPILEALNLQLLKLIYGVFCAWNRLIYMRYRLLLILESILLKTTHVSVHLEVQISEET